ncbi:MAG TPA: LuxR C-terminal-related transcriptional regulator [Propionibacteriaceae bacterium]|nr:LuxR C-terminal-related transcriptional regulator [Propionibacteriaceae bacterium]
MLVGNSRPLLMAKLLVPRLPPTTVTRGRLEGRLAVEPHVRLTTVVAPAGWGKTTLLAAWAGGGEGRGRTGWLSLDEADDEPVRFWTYALSALDRVAPTVTRESLAALNAPGMDPIGVALTALLNALTTAEDSYALVLDDYHVLSDPMIHSQVEFLLAYLPPALHLVIAGRADPPLPLARMRARGELNEVRLAELRCTTAEGARLVTGVSGLSELALGTTNRLVERTEGWPAGLQLAALTLRESGNFDAAAAELSGDRRHILDYFAAEVLPGLEVNERQLLVQCSVLERLSGPLCDAVLGTKGAGDVLAQLHRDGVFFSALGGGWYRCHRLFRDVLRRELEREVADQASAVLTRAADWFLAEGRLEEAIEHRQAAGDSAEALELLLTGDRWFLDRGAAAAFLRLGEQLAAQITSPRLFVALAVAAGESGQYDRCLHWLTAAEPLIEAGSKPLPGWHTLRGQADTIWATFPAAGDADSALRYATRAAELETDPTKYGHLFARHVLGSALLSAGRLSEGLELLRECWGSPLRRELPSLFALQSAGQLALILVEAEDVAGASRISREVRDLAAAAEEAWGPGAAAALAGLRLAEARLLSASDSDRAMSALVRAVDLAEVWGWPTLVVAALSQLAAAQWAAGDRAVARLTLKRAKDAVATGEARPGAVQRLEALEARIGRGATTEAHARGALAEELTDRELSILRALRGPLSAREIGSEMYLSVNTVKGYTKSLYRKLGVVARADAVRRGHELGLI